MMSHHNKIKLGSTRISAVNLLQALDELDQMVKDGGRHYVCFCESNLFVHAQKNNEVSRVLNQASMVLPDGFFLMALAMLLGRPLPQRLTGPSFLLAACEHGLSRGYRHFFYGGAPGVPENLVVRLKHQFPGLMVTGTYSPPFRHLTAEEEEEIMRKIEDGKPHFLWVALGAPKQELWIAEHLHRLNIPVQFGVGAAFDFHSGNVPWAPYWIRRIGMEWAFRMLTGGPRVFWRNLRCVTSAALLLVGELWRVRVCKQL